MTVTRIVLYYLGDRIATKNKIIIKQICLEQWRYFATIGWNDLGATVLFFIASTRVRTSQGAL